jgi:hypothetical protein
VVFSAARDIFHPGSEEEKASVKNKYTKAKNIFCIQALSIPEKI